MLKLFRIVFPALPVLPSLVVGAFMTFAVAGQQTTLRGVSEFTSIEGNEAKSIAVFKEAGKVIQSPRCMNCHPAGDHPLQGDNSHPHQPPVTRGVDGLGAIGMRCTTCHGQTNFDAGHVPGNPQWHLAPIEMAWVGHSLGAICEQIKDPKRNGGRSLKEIVEHMASDELVGWAWHPDPGRTPAPGTQKDFGELIKLWVKTGAHCPPA